MYYTLCAFFYRLHHTYGVCDGPWSHVDDDHATGRARARPERRERATPTGQCAAHTTRTVHTRHPRPRPRTADRRQRSGPSRPAPPGLSLSAFHGSPLGLSGAHRPRGVVRPARCAPRARVTAGPRNSRLFLGSRGFRGLIRGRARRVAARAVGRAVAAAGAPRRSPRAARRRVNIRHSTSKRESRGDAPSHLTPARTLPTATRSMSDRAA